VIEPADRSKIGIVEWFRPGEYVRVKRSIERLTLLGIKHVRTHVSWADYLAPGGVAWYDWLLEALGSKFTLLPCLHYTPPDLSETGRTSGPPRRLLDFADFTDTVITRYGAYFTSIELWNEPNNLLDWDWREDIGWRKFSEMIGAAAHWAQVCGKRTVLGGPCPTDMNWLRLMGERGVLMKFDVVGIHGFPATWDSVDAGIFPGWGPLCDKVAEVTLSFNPALLFWITETGYSTWRQDQAAQARSFLDAIEAPVGRVYWYGLQDIHASISVQEGRNFDQRHYHFGLDTVAGQPKLLGRLLEGGVAAVRATLDLDGPARAPAVIGRRPIFVTGGAGFIGANLVDRLAADGNDVLVYDGLARAGVEHNLRWLRRRHPSRVSACIGDLRDEQAVGDACADATAFFHLAGQVAVTTSMLQPLEDFEINTRGTLNLLDVLRRRNSKAPFIFASTNKVYGDLSDITLVCQDSQYRPEDLSLTRHGISESRDLHFHTPYGCSKGAADQYVLDYAKSYGLRTAVLRMSCIYGERQLGTEDQGWVAHFLLRAIGGETITIYGDGMQVRDILHVGDAIGAYLAAWKNVDRIAGRAYNLGGGPENAISLRQLVEHISLLLQRPVDVEYSAWRPGDQRYFVADTRAVRRDLALPEPLGWHEGVSRLAKYFNARRLNTDAFELAAQ